MRAEQTEFAVANDCDTIGTADLYALEDAACGGERFGEDGVLVENFIGNDQKIFSRKLQKLCVCAITPDDAEHSA